jgi:Haem-NO-binding
VHGLIFASLRDYSIRRLGADGAERLWVGASYATDLAYGDGEFRDRLESVGRALGLPNDELQRDFGAFAARTTFAGLFPDYFAGSGDTLTFLLGVEEKIHELVRATIPGAYPPNLHVRPLGRDGVLVSYTSQRQLCHLLEGLVRGTAAHYGERVELEELQCMRSGDPGCVWSVVSSARADTSERRSADRA